MASKRMFDRAIIETDHFLNVSLSAKAIYFLLGMEADDEGFVSPLRIVRLYGGEPGDIKNLIDAGLIIPFKSGVVVITDWNQNNWLDGRRIKPTQYQNEKKMLTLTEDKKYELSDCLADAKTEERRIEENSIEEERERTPSQIATEFFKAGPVYGEMVEVFSKDRDRAFTEKEFGKFSLYWTEPNKSGTKVRWQQEGTFEIKRRLLTWMNRAISYSGGSKRGTGAGIAI